MLRKLFANGIATVCRMKRHQLQCRMISTSFRSPIAEVTQPAPDFNGTAVIEGQFKDISLLDFAGKYLVLFFYPLDFSFLCPTEIIDLDKKLPEFKSMNASVVAVSTDSRFSHLASINTPRNKYGFGNIKIPLLSDFTKDISKSYGVLVERAGVALRGTFIIDANGTVRHLSVNDFSVGRSIEETLRLVQAFQHSDKHGQLCPSSWSPGEESIKPTVEGSKEYFDKI